MKNKVYLLVLLVGLFQILSCKKDSKQPIQQQTTGKSLENGISGFSIDGQLLPAIIDTGKNLITVVIPHGVNLKNLTVNFSLASQVNATINNQAVSSGAVVDFTKLTYLTVTSADKKRSTSFEVSVQTDLFYEGLIGNLIAEKSLNKSYNFYYDQFDGTIWSSVNCGPAVAAMAAKWADSTFNKTPGEARQVYEPDGGEWSTRNIFDYLRDDNVDMEQYPTNNLDSLVKANIDKGQPIIFCLDIYYVSVDNLTYHHVNKYYPSIQPGTGHFILVKGYKQMQNGFYLEVYDPWSQHLEYYPSIIPHEPFGQDRYYLDTDIKKATDVWDATAYVIALKGKKVTNSLNISNAAKRQSIHLAYGR